MTEDKRILTLDRLRDAREKRGITYKQIAERSGLPEVTVQRIFSGKTLSPTIDTFDSIVTAMGVPIGEIFDDNFRVDLNPNTERYFDTPAADIHHTEVVNMYQREIAQKDKWILRLFICLAVLVFFGIALIFVDLMLPGVGFMRR